MFIQKIVSMVLVFLGLSVSAVGSSDSVALGDLNSEVKLLNATINQACSSCGQFKGVIVLKNRAYKKSVVVHYEVGSSVRKQLPAQFVTMVSGTDEEYWAFETGSLSSVLNEPVRFAIRYDVDGQTFWDNNCGQNYLLDAKGLTGSGPIKEVKGHLCPQ